MGEYETRIRMDEIKQFASNNVPKPRFIFDNYQVQPREFSDVQTESKDEVQEGIEKITQETMA